MIYDLVYVIMYIFGIFYIKNYMRAFLGKECSSRPVYIFSYLLYPIIVCSLYFFVNIPVVNLAGNVISLIIISLNYNAGVPKRIALIAFLYIFMLFIEMGTAIATGYMGISAFDTGTYSEPLGPIIVGLILYLFSLISLKIKKIKDNEKISPFEWFAAVFIPISSAYIIILLLEKSNMDKSQCVAAVLLLLTINVLVFYIYEALLESYDTKISMILYEHEKDYYYNQCKYMEDSSKHLKSFKHDIKNHMIAILGNIREKKYDDAEKYIKSILGDELTDKMEYCNTGNIAVDSVLNYKFKLAIANNVALKNDINIPNDLIIAESDITVIVGNLLDNAITATTKLAPSERRISVKMNYDKGRMFILVENTFDGIYKQKDGEYQSLKPNRTDHGYGIKNVKRVIEKYDGYLDIDPKNSIFKALVILYVKPKEKSDDKTLKQERIYN